MPKNSSASETFCQTARMLCLAICEGLWRVYYEEKGLQSRWRSGDFVVSEAEIESNSKTCFPIEKRLDDLVSRMTLEERVSQMTNPAPAVEILGIPRYDWWNATGLPQA